MRRLILSVNVTLDGYTSGPSGELDWLQDYVTSDACAAYLRRFMGEVDTVLLGRKNYQGFSHYWPPIADDPGAPSTDAAFSRWLNQVEKIVFSTTLAEVLWENSRLVRSIDRDEIEALKGEDGGNLFIMNSTAVAQVLLEMDLIDEVRLNVFPVVLGDGTRLFATPGVRTDLRLVEASASAFGVLECVYEVVGPRRQPTTRA